MTDDKLTPIELAELAIQNDANRYDEYRKDHDQFDAEKREEFQYKWSATDNALSAIKGVQNDPEHLREYLLFIQPEDDERTLRECLEEQRDE